LFGMRSLCLLALLYSLCLGHGTVINPAMRDNPTVSGGWCPWCQGDQVGCSDKVFCDPPSPCWGAPGPTTVGINPFNNYANLKDSNGNYWIDHTRPNASEPIWCPSQTIEYSFMNFADHNGIFQFQIMPGKPGDEKEALFKPFTAWKSINNDPDTIYYDEDGVTPLKPGICKDGTAWAPTTGHCKDGNLYKSNFTLPALTPGNYIFRWIWYGAMTVDGKRVTGPEPSLFANCKDVIIGSPSQCNKIL